MSNLEHCKKLLKQNRNYKIEYGAKLANHLSMALISLYKMGASIEQMDNFYNQYTEKLVPFNRDKKNISESFSQEDLVLSLGGSDKFSTHLSFFENEIEQKGISETLRIYIPILLPGLCASAFHALIRLAYGVEMEDKDEIAFALAFWSSEFQPLGKLSETVDKSLLEILTDMIPIARSHEFKKGLIVDHMVEIAELESYKKAIFQPKNIKLKDIADLAINAFLGTSSFTILHGVTACHAMRIILPFIENKNIAIRYYWQGFLTAYLSTGAVEILDKKNINKYNSFSEIKELICSEISDHDVKMVYTCFSEYKEYGSKEYLDAANKVLVKTAIDKG